MRCFLVDGVFKSHAIVVATPPTNENELDWFSGHFAFLYNLRIAIVITALYLKAPYRFSFPVIVLTVPNIASGLFALRPLQEQPSSSKASFPLTPSHQEGPIV